MKRALFLSLFLSLAILLPGLTYAQGSPRTPLENHRVLLLGDSQVAGAFGSALIYELIACGVTYCTRSGQEGWGIVRWWQNRGEVRRLILTHQPTLVLLAFGGNDHERSNRADYSVEIQNFWDFVQEQMRYVHGRNRSVPWRVLWISPATAVGPSIGLQPGRDRVAEVIHQVVTSRNYVESRDVTGFYGRTPDGIHFTYGGGIEWARLLRPRIEDCLRR